EDSAPRLITTIAAAGCGNRSGAADFAAGAGDVLPAATSRPSSVQYQGGPRGSRIMTLLASAIMRAATQESRPAIRPRALGSSVLPKRRQATARTDRGISA